MNSHLKIITSILRKDFRSLILLLLAVYSVISLDSVVSRLDIEVSIPILANLISALPSLNLLVIGLLTIAVVQLDPAVSQDHDWLTRPIPKYDLLLAKLLFLMFSLLLPIFLIRVITNIAIGYALLPAIVEASIPEFPFTIPAVIFFLATAILSPSLIKAIILFFTVVVLFTVFAFTWESFPTSSGALGDNGGTTQAVLPIFSSIMIGTFAVVAVLIFWIQYVKRESKIARTVFLFSALAATAAFIAPFTFSYWDFFLESMQSNLDNRNQLLADNLEIDPVYACYPAAILSTDDPNTVVFNPSDYSGKTKFQNRDFRNAGNGALAFTTRVSAWGIPDNTRVFPLKATARFSAAGLPNEQSIRSSQITSGELLRQSSDVLTNHWLLPKEIVDKIKSDSKSVVSLDYSLALLTPVKTLLETDGVRRVIPDLGYCRADRNSVRNLVEVECFKRGIRPTLVGAQLPGIESSLILASPPNFTSRWAQMIGGSRYRILIESPSLIDSSSIELVKFESRAVVERSIESQGLLNASIDNCPLPGDTEQRVYARSSWNDTSPHQVLYVTVDDEVSLEVLDWGGTGPTLVFLAGLGLTGHSFDEIAPLFADSHRVIAITRRGFGNSVKPNSGYSIDRLSSDILEVLDSLAIDAPILIGHSIAGDELSTFAVRYPERVSGLVYLDAAYDRTGIPPSSMLLPQIRRPSKNEFSSYEAAQAYYNSLEITAMPEGELMSIMNLDNGTRSADSRIAGAIISQITKPQYENISAPALGIFATNASPQQLMQNWYSESDPKTIAEVEKRFEIRSSYQQSQIEYFDSTLANSEVLVIEGGDHAIFVSHKNEVVNSILHFVEETWGH